MSMPNETKSKINRLVSQWPRGAPAAASYLNTKGFSHDLLTKYKKSGWLQSFVRGAYVLTGDRVEWPGAVYALQEQLGLNVHPGGKTALELKGYAHYLPSGNRTIFLYATQGLIFLTWFKGERLGVDVSLTRTNLFPAAPELGFLEVEEKELSVRISAQERAAMEMLHLVPGTVGFDEASRITESLATLRSEMVQRLLQACRSIKVKRLFLAMAERHGHPWVSELDLSPVDLGKGKQMSARRALRQGIQDHGPFGQLRRGGGMRDTVFFRQAELLLRILPLIHKEEAFALKGGTAINFFVQDLPRLSVDIDLTYLPLHERDLALDEIRNGLARMADAIKGRMPGAGILLKRIHGTDVVRGLIVERNGTTVKVEPNLVLRGSVYPAETKTLSKKARDFFELSLNMRILSPHDLYAGKICAALDRQHPRDLFDVHLLFKTAGLDPQTRKAFLVYLVSHPRPMVEILNPQKKDIEEVFDKEFKGMIAEPVTLEDLAATRERLVSMMGEGLSTEERRFVVSVKEGRPEWGLLGLEGVQNLPGIKRKLLNISRMDRAKHRQAVRKLRDCLGV